MSEITCEHLSLCQESAFYQIRKGLSSNPNLYNPNFLYLCAEHGEWFYGRKDWILTVI